MRLVPYHCSTSSLTDGVFFFSLLTSDQTVLLLQHVSLDVCDSYSRSGFTHIHACLYTHTHTHTCTQVERDVFDKLFEEAPEKLEAVKRVRRYVCKRGAVFSSLECYHVVTASLRLSHFLPLPMTPPLAPPPSVTVPVCYQGTPRSRDCHQ